MRDVYFRQTNWLITRKCYSFFKIRRKLYLYLCGTFSSSFFFLIKKFLKCSIGCKFNYITAMLEICHSQPVSIIKYNIPTSKWNPPQPCEGSDRYNSRSVHKTVFQLTLLIKLLLWLSRHLKIEYWL